MSINSIGNYTIQKGDCLWKIAQNHYKTENGEKVSNAEIAKIVDKMVELNDIKNPDLIFADDELKMPEYDGFEVQIEDEDLDEDDDEKDNTKKATVEDFTKKDITEIKIKDIDDTQPKDSAAKKNESKTTGGKKDGTEKFSAFADWSANTAINAAAAGEAAGSKISNIKLDNEEYQKQYNKAYGEAYTKALANTPDFSVLKEGESIPEGEATLEPYMAIAQSQIETYNTSKDNKTLDLKEYIMGELTQYSNHYDDIDLKDIEKEANKFIEQYKKDPAKIEENNMTEMFTKIANVHNFFDFNGDGVLEQDEIAQYYHILDVSDSEEGKQDGIIEFNSFAHWDGIASTEGDERTEIKTEFVNQYKEKHPEKF